MPPHAARWDAEHHFPSDVLRKAAELGFAAMFAAEEYGGTGLSRADGAVIFEALSYADVGRPPARRAQLTLRLPCVSSRRDQPRPPPRPGVLHRLPDHPQHGRRGHQQVGGALREPASRRADEQPCGCRCSRCQPARRAGAAPPCAAAARPAGPQARRWAPGHAAGRPSSPGHQAAPALACLRHWCAIRCGSGAGSPDRARPAVAPR
jgi:hypothetical protein